jgi:electron transport complex protein RnfG
MVTKSDPEEMVMLIKSMSRNALLLGVFALLTTALIAATFLNTQDSIAENIRQAEEKALLEIVPRSRHNNSMLDDTQPIADSQLLGLRTSKTLYIARQDGQPVAVILPTTATDGYSGDIDMIVGINSNGTVAGVRVLSHRETPGLGDGIDRKKSTWVDGFAGRSLSNPTAERWTVKKDGGDFDQFTGATITPRAVTQAVARALQYFQSNKTALLSRAQAKDSLDEQ